MSSPHTNVKACAAYQGETFSMYCLCTVCGCDACDHPDQQAYCDECRQTHWGDHNHCYLADLSDDEVSKP